MARLIALLSVALFGATGQTWTGIPKSSTVFRSFDGSGMADHPQYPWHLVYPNSDEASKDTGCDASTSTVLWWLRAHHSATDQTLVWAGPLAGHFWREPSSVYITSRLPTLRGLRFRGTFAGRIAANQDKVWNAVTSAVFYHREYCYDGGAEFGFYHVLQRPGDTAEVGTVYFYYSANTNCMRPVSYPLQSPANAPRLQTACQDKKDASVFLSDEIAPANPANGNRPGVPIAIIPGRDYEFSAYLVNAQSFQVEVRAIDDGAFAFQRSVPVEKFFAPDAGAMLRGDSPGFITFTLQKQLKRAVNYDPLSTMSAEPGDAPRLSVNKLEVVK